jgi:hypothetical protein
MPNFRRHAFIVVLTALVSFISLDRLAHAEDFSAKLFGHGVSVSRNKDFEQQLRIDDKIVIKDSIVSIEDVRVIDGVGVAIGYTSAGGNACNESYFVLSFPIEQPVRIDGPTGNCFSITYVVEPKGIRFSTEASVSRAGETWSWTPTDGMSQKTAVAFSESPSSDAWNDLRSRKISHPGEFFKYRALSAQLDSLLGVDRASVLPIVNGVGSVEYKGDVVLATSCVPHQCDETGTLIVIDLPTKKLFLAWRPSKRPTIVRPALETWTPAARAELASWPLQRKR